MNISITTQDISSWNGSVLVLGVLEGRVEELFSTLNLQGLKSKLSSQLSKSNFCAKAKEKKVFQLLDFGELEKIVLIGLGNPEGLELDDIRNAASIGSRESIGSEGILGMIFPWDIFGREKTAQAVAESARLTRFKDLRFKSTQKKVTFPNQLDLIGITKIDDSSIERVNPICAGVELARELVAAPPNVLTPQELANQAVFIAEKYQLTSRVLEKDECESIGMGAYLAVAKGSDLDPKFIHLTYTSPGKISKRVVLVGKGLTFDSGGYNLKVGASQIEKMKYDMGGSAAVLGAARAIGELKPEGIEVHFIVAACENMVNGSAFHPGDIIKAANGTTIEVNNTDAEGRLTLADALVYACKIKPDHIIDLATLTGACVIALGDEIAGLWTEDDELANQLQEAGRCSGEGIWRMPMQNSYKAGLKSKIADLQNTGPRAGGSITAALFLKEFVDKNIKWAHIDIAGTCWTEKNRGLNPVGATGYGVRLLIQWLLNLIQ